MTNRLLIALFLAFVLAIAVVIVAVVAGPSMEVRPHGALEETDDAA